ncbi:hypothetical protein [Streptomyces peucetius]|uniref:Uncharacterized protein n=1 Tax=Streptomyces peucetius TaxID=1950 RepID=A0ABY6I148_STRPE|nr:hypothetical protein [Streptomyces peucetius]UYQ60702.1 hypothetical protein OGH68_03975 [Streptomyces peucetius]
MSRNVPSASRIAAARTGPVGRMRAIGGRLGPDRVVEDDRQGNQRDTAG